MRIDILSAVPSLLESPFNDSILKRAQSKNLVEIFIHNIRDYSTNKQKSIDDYAYGGGAGMVLSIEPIDKCIHFCDFSSHVFDIFDHNNKQIYMLCMFSNLVVVIHHY